MTAPQSKDQSCMKKLLVVWPNSPFWEAGAVIKSYEIVFSWAKQIKKIEISIHCCAHTTYN